MPEPDSKVVQPLPEKHAMNTFGFCLGGFPTSFRICAAHGRPTWMLVCTGSSIILTMFCKGPPIFHLFMIIQEPSRDWKVLAFLFSLFISYFMLAA